MITPARPSLGLALLQDVERGRPPEPPILNLAVLADGFQDGSMNFGCCGDNTPIYVEPSTSPQLQWSTCSIHQVIMYLTQQSSFTDNIGILHLDLILSWRRNTCDDTASLLLVTTVASCLTSCVDHVLIHHLHYTNRDYKCSTRHLRASRLLSP